MARLDHAEFRVYRLPYVRPVRWADTAEDGALFVLLRLVGDNGAVGVSEVTVKPTWNGMTPRSLISSVEDLLLPRVRECDLDDPVAVRRMLDSVPENTAGKALVDNACWDLAAAGRREPLWRTWGGRADLPLSWAVTRQAPTAMGEEAIARVEEFGFRTLKVKGGQGIETDLEAMRAIRSAVGDDVELYVDANGAYAAGEAREYVQRMAEAGAVVVEDPCAIAPNNAFSELQASSPVPILVDFNCTSLNDSRLFIERGALALSLKPGRLGLTDTYEMARLAQARGLRTVVGLFGESLLGSLTALQLASTLPSTSLPAEVTWYLAMNAQILPDGISIRGGKLALPDCSSIASLVDWGLVERYAP